MRDIEISDVLLLARANLDDSASELKQLYQWRFEYLSTAAKGVVAVGASLVISLLAAALQHDAKQSWTPVIIGAVGALAVLAAGWFMHRRIRLIYREYVSARDLLGEALKVRAFLRLYEGKL